MTASEPGSAPQGRSFRNGIQWAWDATSLSTYMTCPRKYYYSMIRQISPVSKSVHLIFGGHYATALEHFYKHRALGDDIDTALRKIVREALEASWLYDESGASLGPQEFLDSKKTRFNLIRSIVWYIDQFGDESESGIRTHHLPSGKPAVELSFTIDLEEDFVLCGHLDRVVDYGGSLYVMDQKTTGGTISQYFFDGFKPDVQMSLYAIAGQVTMQSPVAGVIIDAAQIAVSFTRFERGFTYRSADENEENLRNFKHYIEQAQTHTALGQFPMNTTACGNYGGCPFKKLCSAPPRHRDSVIAAEYQPKIWDPIERR